MVTYNPEFVSNEQRQKLLGLLLLLCIRVIV
jgi:hypothetical protein